MYVPLVRITIEPVQNAERPGIEKTHRSQSCPVYAVALFRAKWGRQAQVITSKLEANEDALWPVPLLPGMDHAASEEHRLRAQFPRGVFDRVFRADEFAEVFAKHAVAENPREDERRERMEQAANKGSEIAAEALLKVAGENAARRARQASDKERRAPKVATTAKVPGKGKALVTALLVLLSFALGDAWAAGGHGGHGGHGRHPAPAPAAEPTPTAPVVPSVEDLANVKRKLDEEEAAAAEATEAKAKADEETKALARSDHRRRGLVIKDGQGRNVCIPQDPANADYQRLHRQVLRKERHAPEGFHADPGLTETNRAEIEADERRADASAG